MADEIIEYVIDFTVVDAEPLEIEMLADEIIEMSIIDGPVTINVNEIIEEELAGDIDGANTIFNTQMNYLTGSTRVYVNGIKQVRNVDYYESGSREITFSDAPASEGFPDSLIINYIKNIGE